MVVVPPGDPGHWLQHHISRLLAGRCLLSELVITAALWREDGSDILRRAEQLRAALGEGDGDDDDLDDVVDDGGDKAITCESLPRYVLHTSAAECHNCGLNHQPRQPVPARAKARGRGRGRAKGRERGRLPPQRTRRVLCHMWHWLLGYRLAILVSPVQRTSTAHNLLIPIAHMHHAPDRHFVLGERIPYVILDVRCGFVL